MTLTELLGIDDAAWMSNPDRPCAGTPDADTKPARRAFGRHVDLNWHPDGAKAEDRAKANCDGCPVKVQCLQYALDNGEESGIWGGLTTLERQQLMKGDAA